MVVSFDIFRFEFNGQPMILLAPRIPNTYTPHTMAMIAGRIEEENGSPCVFLFESLTTNERDRLIRQGVYFVVNRKYAFIPTLLINRKTGKTQQKNFLLPSSQYILLSHIQQRDLDGITLREMTEIMPYRYSTIAKSVNQLVQFGLAEEKTENVKHVFFKLDKKELWNLAQQYLINPVKQILYADEVLPGIIGGISALAHYSILASEEVPTRVWISGQEKSLYGQEIRLNESDGIQRIEIWQYPPILQQTDIADKLSVYLSLRNDKDPRVAKELETMINEMQW